MQSLPTTALRGCNAGRWLTLTTSLGHTADGDDDCSDDDYIDVVPLSSQSDAGDVLAMYG